MLFSDITVLTEDFQFLPHAYVATRGDRIAYVGSEKPAGDFGPVYDGKDKLLLPGLVNAHAHVPMVLLRGYAENMALNDWLNKKVFPFEALINRADMYWGASLGIAEMLRYGITSFSDMYSFCDRIVEAAETAGIHMNISRGVIDFSHGGLKSLEAWKEIEWLFDYCGDNRGSIRHDLCIHGEYTSYPSLVEEIAALAKGHNTLVHIHLSETQAEHEECIARHGMTPTAYFKAHGLLDQPVLAAHCVYVTDEDIDILKDHKATAALNPVSNLKLASGFAPVPTMLKKGLNVALGTDGMASNNSHNLWEEVKLMAILYKASTGDPTAVSPKDALYAATRGGAIAQGRMDAGLVKEGFAADLCVMDIDRPYMHPCFDLMNNLVYSAQGSDICLTMAGGKVLYKDGEYLTLDIEKITAEATARAYRIAGEVNA